MRRLPIGAGMAPLFVAFASAASVDLTIFYGPMCSRCMFYLSQMLPPLFQANLPGDQVIFTMYPWVMDANGQLPAPPQCTDPSQACHYLPAPLCALQAVPMPAPIDSVPMINAYKFMICDLAHANAGSPVPQTPATIQACASQSAVDTPMWRACVQQNQRSPQFQAKERMAWERLHTMPQMMVPFIFINGKILNCDAPTNCNGWKSPTGAIEPLPPGQGGSLIKVVCSMMTGMKPPGCTQYMQKSEDHRGLAQLLSGQLEGMRFMSLGFLGAAVLLGVLVLLGFTVTRQTIGLSSRCRRACARRTSDEGVQHYTACSMATRGEADVAEAVVPFLGCDDERAADDAPTA